MHDHALHEFHIRWRTRRQRGPRRRRQCPGRLAWRARLHHDWRGRVSLLGEDGKRAQASENTAGHKPAPQHCDSYQCPKLILTPKMKTIHCNSTEEKWSGRRGSNLQNPAWESKTPPLYFHNLQNRCEKINVHAVPANYD
jgi:hypothetical protein